MGRKCRKRKARKESTRCASLYRNRYILDALWLDFSAFACRPIVPLPSGCKLLPTFADKIRTLTFFKSRLDSTSFPYGGEFLYNLLPEVEGCKRLLRHCRLRDGNDRIPCMHDERHVDGFATQRVTAVSTAVSRGTGVQNLSFARERLHVEHVGSPV